VTLEVLFFDGCPSHEQLLASLRQLAAQHGAELRERRIETPQDAERERFLGSPSVRVDGVDVDPGARERTDFGLKCRLYRSTEGQAGLPPRQWIDGALRQAASRRKAGTRWTVAGCCGGDELPDQLNGGQRHARTVVGLIALVGSAVLLARCPAGALRATSTLLGVGAGWFGVSHLVAARTGYAGCPELGAIPTLVKGREVKVGCVPWRIADRRLGLTT